MKRKNALIAASSALCMLASCQSSPKEQVYSRPMDEFGRGDLTVAYMNYGNPNVGYDVMLSELTSVYRNLKITAQPYASLDEFLTEVSTQLNAGKGPDLFLLNTGAPFSFQKMVQNGTYVDLTPYLEADSRFTASDYGGLSAGQIDGKQYLLPISLASHAFYTTEENLKKLDLTLADFDSPEHTIAALEKAADYAAGNDCQLLLPVIYRDDLGSFWLDVFNLPVLDFEKKEVLLDKELYKRLADLGRRIWPDFREIRQNFLESFRDSAELESRLFVLTNDDKIASMYCQYSTRMEALGQTAVRIPSPAYQDNSKAAGLLDCYAAVNSHSKDPLLAYETARILMDYPWEYLETHIFNFSVPAHIGNYQRELMKLNSGTEIMLDNDRIKLKAPVNVREKIVNTVADTKVIDINIAFVFSETMIGYIKGETDDFEACWENLINRLTLYLTE